MSETKKISTITATSNGIRYIANSHNFYNFNTINNNIILENTLTITNDETYNTTIGIGTINPNYTLEVIGTAKFNDIYGYGSAINNINVSNIISGNFNADTLPISSVISGSYGSSKLNPSFTVDSYGRIINIANVSINSTINSSTVLGLSKSATINTTNAFNITIGIINTNRLPSFINAILIGDGSRINSLNISNSRTGTLSSIVYPKIDSIIPGNYISGTNTLKIEIDSYGRITNITNNEVNIDYINAINASNITIGTFNTNLLPLSGVSSGSYGSKSSLIQLSVDNYGRITTIQNVDINVVSISSVIGLNKSASIDTTDATNITTGFFNSSRLPNIINANSFIGNATNITNINASNINIGLLSTSLYPIISTLNVTVHGRVSNSLSITVDNYGRITNISNNIVSLSTSISNINASNLSTGTFDIRRLNVVSTITPSVYGNSSNLISIRVDNYGRITSISNIIYTIASNKITGLSTSATIDTTNASNISIGLLNTVVLPNIVNATFRGIGSGITNINASNISIGNFSPNLFPSIFNNPTVYGNTGTIGLSISIDSYGRVTSVSNTIINFERNASDITTGTLNASRLPSSGVSSGTYGSSSNILSIIVDQYGRITSVSNVLLNIAYTSVFGLSTSATIDTTNASNITSGIISTSILPSVINASFSGVGSSLSNLNTSNINFNTLNIQRYPTLNNIYTNKFLLISGLKFNVYNGFANYNPPIIFQGGLVTNFTNISTSTSNYWVSTYTNRSVEWTGFFIPDQTGIWTFYSASDDQSYVWIGYLTEYTDANAVVNNGGTHGTVEKSGTINLTSGNKYPIRFRYSQAGGGYSFSVSFTSPSSTTRIYDGIGYYYNNNDYSIPSISNTSINVYTLSVDIYGRITSIQNTSLIRLENASSITTGTLDIERFPTTGIKAYGKYGGETNIVVLEVDSYGRVSNVSNIECSIKYTNVYGLSTSATIDTTNATNITSGILNRNILPTVINGIHINSGLGLTNINASNILGVVSTDRYPTMLNNSGSYGSSKSVLNFNVDIYGRIRSISNTEIIVNETFNISNASNYTVGSISVFAMNSQNITNVGIFGSVANTLNITVDSYGRVTSVSNNIVYISYTKITGLATSATINTTNASNITSGILSIPLNYPGQTINGRFTGAGKGLYNLNPLNLINVLSASSLPTSTLFDYKPNTIKTSYSSFTIDIYGRVTDINPLTIDASTITEGVFPVARLPLSGATAGSYGGASSTIRLTVDKYGRVISISQVPIKLYYNQANLPQSTEIDTVSLVNLGTNSIRGITYGNYNQNITINSKCARLYYSYSYNSIRYMDVNYRLPIYKVNNFYYLNNIKIPFNWNGSYDYRFSELSLIMTIDTIYISSTNITIKIPGLTSAISTQYSIDNNNTYTVENLGDINLLGILRNVSNTNTINITIKHYFNNNTSQFQVDAVYTNSSLNNVRLYTSCYSYYNGGLNNIEVAFEDGNTYGSGFWSVIENA